MGYTRVTGIIGPKMDVTAVILEVEVSMDDYLALEASLNGRDLDDVLREIIHVSVTTTHDRD